MPIREAGFEMPVVDYSQDEKGTLPSAGPHAVVVSKISLPVLPTTKKRTDFLPLVLISAILLFSFIVGQRIGNFAAPITPISVLAEAVIAAPKSGLSAIGFSTRGVWAKKPVAMAGAAKISLLDSADDLIVQMAADHASFASAVGGVKNLFLISTTTLDNFDQTSTAYLSGFIFGAGNQILIAKQTLFADLDEISSRFDRIPGIFLTGSDALIWSPISEQTAVAIASAGNLTTDNWRLVMDADKKIKDSLARFITLSWQSVGRLVDNISSQTAIGYRYVVIKVNQAVVGQSTDLAAIRFTSLSQTATEFSGLIGDRLRSIWSNSVDFMAGLWQAAVRNWRGFLGLSAPTDTAPGIIVATTTLSTGQIDQLTEQIKTQLRDDLRQEFNDIVRRTSANNLSVGGNQGLIVAPSAGNAAADAKLKADLQQMFSDQVYVDFDRNRKAGVITPVFNPSDNYIFILAPVKQ